MKITHLSDTHTKESELTLEYCDVLIHSGDFSTSFQTLHKFIHWFRQQPSKYKIMVAGNHDQYISEQAFDSVYNELKENGIIYLLDSEVIIEGVKFYGTPWTSIYGKYAFMKAESTLCYYWENIPDDVNVLITHGPAYGILDYIPKSNKKIGSPSLTYRLSKLKELKFHLFGHAHEAYGKVKVNNYMAINSAQFDLRLKRLREPHFLEIN